MKLQCSAGHEYDTDRVTALGNPRAGDRCPMELSYDRMNGSRYCRRIIKPVESVEEAVKRVSKEWNTRRLDGNSHENWRWIHVFAFKVDGMPAAEKIAAEILSGNKVKGGWTATNIRGYHDRWILVSISSQNK